MSVRVVARIRPLLSTELDKNTIVTAHAQTDEPGSLTNIVRIPNPKNEGEQYSFQFNSVYDEHVSQQELFEKEVAPTVKHLFNGFDVTLFAYGVTGTGKTHTMRGGKSIADRGVIPRFLSSIYRRSRKIEKDSKGDSKVTVSMSYYEIYNDKVFDLYDVPEKRTPAGLPLRDNGGKTVVVGLTERPCDSLKEFEKLYDQANVNRSTSATKLNAHSSRSHAILCVKVSITTGDQVRESVASAIDLAGSEDNRRTDNNRDRMVESASINKSLFVLAQCVEAISKKQSRIPYRESKMTRILSLGQNNGFTVMILNLAPVRSYHLDTLSSLNFANRTKKIEVREVENEPVFKGCSRPVSSFTTAPSLQRQPLRPLGTAGHNANVRAVDQNQEPGKDKPMKAFAVFSDKPKMLPIVQPAARNMGGRKGSSPLKRPLDQIGTSTRPTKRPSPSSLPRSELSMSKAAIESMISQKVEEILAAKTMDQTVLPGNEISGEVKQRLERLERRIEERAKDGDDGRTEGHQFILLGKQHYVRGELGGALKMFELAREHFPNNVKLEHKIERVRKELEAKKTTSVVPAKLIEIPGSTSRSTRDVDDSYHHDSADDNGDGSEAEDSFRGKIKKRKAPALPESFNLHADPTPRTHKLLSIINTRDVTRIRLLKGVGAKRAEAIVEALFACDNEGADQRAINSLGELGRLRGVGAKTVASMRLGL